MLNWLWKLLGYHEREELLWLHQGLPPQDLIGVEVLLHGRKGICVAIKTHSIIVEW